MTITIIIRCTFITIKKINKTIFYGYKNINININNNVCNIINDY